MFRKGGLKNYLAACRNPSHPLYIGDRAEASHCCTKLSAFLVERMAQYNGEVRLGKNPIPYGSKIWIGRSLGLYFTIGNQDLESFFEKGSKLREAAAADNGHMYGSDD